MQCLLLLGFGGELDIAFSGIKMKRPSDYFSHAHLGTNVMWVLKIIRSKGICVFSTVLRTKPTLTLLGPLQLYRWTKSTSHQGWLEPDGINQSLVPFVDLVHP